MAKEHHRYDQSCWGNYLDHDIKKTIFVFPGLTRAFRHRKDAITYLNHQYTREPEHLKGLIKVIFNITVNIGQRRAMDVKKFVNQHHHHDDGEICIPGCDGLFQRLLV